MAKLEWDKTGEKTYETGVKKGVLYPVGSDGNYSKGVVWNGLTSVSENPSGAEETPLYADDQKYLSLYSAEEFGATVEAYTYPDEFAACDGSAEIADGVTIGQQDRSPFGMAYVTTKGNDTKGTSNGYKIHLIYGATASPSSKAYESINNSPSAITFSWEIKTVPINVTGKKATATLVIDSTKVDPAALTKIEDALYGTDNTEAKLLTPDEVVTLINSTGTSGEAQG